MSKKIERRQQPRESFLKAEIGIIYPEYNRKSAESSKEDRPDSLLVKIVNESESGLLIESCLDLETGSSIFIQRRLSNEKSWQAIRGKIIWGHKNPVKPIHYLCGVKYKPATAIELSMLEGTEGGKTISPDDLEFLLKTPLFDSISEDARCPLLNCMMPEHIKAGERLISQGDEGDTFFIIQDGACAVNVEKEGTLHLIARLRAGDIIGEMAILTGEHRIAHVDAETDMNLWGINRGHFDALCEEYPDLKKFLTRLITWRFSAERLTADRTIGKYVINENIGKGGWSIVYRGIHESLSMPVAIKMLKHDMAMNPDFLEKFRNEARTIARLNHENIVKVYDIEELYRTIFIIMEYLDGVPLNHLLEKMQRLSTSRVLDIILQVCAGLAYAHEQGIVHQDIKPANIFIQPDNKAKIVDFGLACSPGTIHSGFTGTLLYMSPEQIEGDPIDERTDIYSLGLTSYEMITGERPLSGDNIADVLDSHLNEDIPDPRTLIPDLPDEIYNFLIRATNRDPAARYRNISQIIHDLKPLAEKMDLKSQSPTGEQRKMMSLFLFYQEEHQLILNRLVEEFSGELKKIGAVIRAADFKDV